MPLPSTHAERNRIRELLAEFDTRATQLETYLQQLQAVLVNPKNALAPHIHSFKWRLKDRQSLRDKFFRKLDTAKRGGVAFDITRENMFVRINDLVGVRILHLHTRQMKEIDTAIKSLIDDAGLTISEGPFARMWDSETRSYFESIGIETRESGPSMYTSVHYVIDSNSKNRYTAELQVRTLAEELWGEVTHSVDYPHPSRDPASREEIRVLARVASSCTRLVDAIFHTHNRAKLAAQRTARKAAATRAARKTKSVPRRERR
jgi:ppGpp synthetase/RelA/SpoT-type nucleotidyltranferase